jgi:hypothetical protein
LAVSARPLTLDGVAALVAARIAALRLGHPVRVAIDGPPWSGLDLAASTVDALGAWSRPSIVIRVADYLRPASLRLEQGRDDPDAFYDEWIDVAGLGREVLEPSGPDGSRLVLPSLWDAARDRASRADYRELPAYGVVIVDGWFLLGAGLSFDLTVHVALSAAARARRVPSDDAARELPAYDRYDAQVRPAERAHVVVRADDPRRPAVVDRAASAPIAEDEC